jgi:hypothetical protein
MAAEIRLVRDTPLTVAEAWRRITDWERHGDVVPLTRVTVLTPPPTAAGTVFVARTGFGGRFGVDDPMELVAWQPPHRCRMEKRGRFVLGWAEFEVRARPGGGARVEWREQLRVRGVPAAADPVLAAAGRWMFGRALKYLMQ